MTDANEGRGAYAGAGDPVVGPFSDNATKHISRTGKYIVVGHPEGTLNWCRSHFGQPNPRRVVRCHTISDLERARRDKTVQGADIILVPGWARKGSLLCESFAYILAAIDGVGC